MPANLLTLSSSKTEFLFIGLKQQFPKLTPQVSVSPGHNPLDVVAPDIIYPDNIPSGHNPLYPRRKLIRGSPSRVQGQSPGGRLGALCLLKLGLV